MLNWMDLNRTFNELDLFRREMDRLFQASLRDELNQGGALSELGRDAHTRLETRDDAFVLAVDLPGVAPDDITLQVTAEGVTLRAERKLVPPEGYSTHRQERGAYRVSRSWTLPVAIDPDAATAEVKHGVLSVHLPKAPEVQPRRINIHS